MKDKEDGGVSEKRGIDRGKEGDIGTEVEKGEKQEFNVVGGFSWDFCGTMVGIIIFPGQTLPVPHSTESGGEEGVCVCLEKKDNRSPKVSLSLPQNMIQI